MQLILPQEIVEKILYNTDYDTLQSAKKVHSDWKQIIEHLSKRRCHRDISHEEILQYTKKWVGGCFKSQHWDQLYDNWHAWQTIESNIVFTNTAFVQETDDVSAICAYGAYVAVGLSNGPVRIYNEIGTLNKIYNILSDSDDEVMEIHFVADSCFEPTELLIVYDDAVFIIDFCDLFAPGILSFEFSYIKSFSAFDNCFSCITLDGFLTIAEIRSDLSKANKTYNVITYVQVYSDAQYVSKCTLSDRICILLINNIVKIVYYKQDNANKTIPVVELTNLQLSVDVESVCRQYAWVFHNKIIINIYYFIEQNEEICEVFLLDEKPNLSVKSIKTFNIWNALNALIYAVYLYGNTLVIGCSDGTILFYNIKDWTLFDIMKYSKRLELPREFGPIRSIDATESNGERCFYISGNVVVYKIVGKQLHE